MLNITVTDDDGTVLDERKVYVEVQANLQRLMSGIDDHLGTMDISYCDGCYDYFSYDDLIEIPFKAISYCAECHKKLAKKI